MGYSNLSIIVKDEKGNYFGLFLEGSKKIGFGKVAALLGSKARIASAEEVRNITGIEPGAICPLLLKIPVIVDKGVLKFDNVNIGSGDHLYGVEINPNDVATLTHALVEEIAQQ